MYYKTIRVAKATALNSYCCQSAICSFDFTYAESWFSHDVAYFNIKEFIINYHKNSLLYGNFSMITWEFLLITH